MIEFSKLTKRFGAAEVLRGVDLRVLRGRVTGIVGPNGAGKTTLIKLLLGLSHPSSGEIRVDGRRLDGSVSYRARVGYMPQSPRLPAHLTARELFATVDHLRESAAGADASLIETFALQDHLDKPLGVLSGGTRQKVNACLAMFYQPSLLVLDEPTAGLDPLSSSMLKDKVLALRSDGTTVLVTSHVMSELEELCDDVAFLLDGVVRYVGPVAELTAMTRQTNLERAVAALMIREVA